MKVVVTNKVEDLFLFGFGVSHEFMYKSNQASMNPIRVQLNFFDVVEITFSDRK